MQYKFLLLAIIFVFSSAFGQDSEGHFMKDAKTGCTVWYKHTFPEDSVSWNGNCKNNFADGFGTLIGYTLGRETSKYVGEMSKGKPNGNGTFTFGNNRKLEGHFSDGEILNLNEECLQHLSKHIIAETDTLELYDGDNNAKLLYYHALVPKGNLIGAVVLMPGTWESTEHLMSSTQTLCEMAYQNHLAVIVPSINQRLTMTDAIFELMNQMFRDAIQRYHIPQNKFVIGGWSMGGLFSLRYTEKANQDSTLAAIHPAGAFSCDGPCDLENIYHNFQLKLQKFPNSNEPSYGIYEMEKYCHGNPENAREKYVDFSCYSHAQSDGGNAKYLLNTPVRIYDDVDPIWWMQNRDVDMYDMNALDQSALILYLNDHGNKQAEFINAFGKGYRIEGNRHPHSWSIVEPLDCVDWILTCIR